jgi:hypothetical protein
MMQTLKLRAIYALHALTPAAFVLWHVDRLHDDTAAALLRLFQG